MKAVNRGITIGLAAVSASAWIYALGGNGVLWWSAVEQYILLFFAITMTGAACVGWVLVSKAPPELGEETLCRRCGYILRGISEPRCPECGEKI